MTICLYEQCKNGTASNRPLTCNDSITGYKMAHWLPNQFTVDATRKFQKQELLNIHFAATRKLWKILEL